MFYLWVLIFFFVCLAFYLSCLKVFAVAVDGVWMCINVWVCFSRLDNASLWNHLWEDEASSSSSAVWNLLVLKQPGNFYPYLPIPAQSRGQ